MEEEKKQKTTAGMTIDQVDKAAAGLAALMLRKGVKGKLTHDKVLRLECKVIDYLENYNADGLTGNDTWEHRDEIYIMALIYLERQVKLFIQERDSLKIAMGVFGRAEMRERQN